MLRAERVLQVLDFLRAHDGTTVAEIAAALGVSDRSIRRDLATLRAQGQPISGDSGPGGGVRLEGGRGVTAVHLSVDEVVSLWVAARLAATASNLPWAKAAQSALQKLLASVPRDRARAMRQICERVVVGRPATAAVIASLGKPAPGLITAFEEAFREGACLSFDYRDRHGATTRRMVEAHGLLVEVPAWYVLALDLEKDAVRMFRLDRMSRPRLLDRRFVPDLDALHRRYLAERARE